ncbi:MAG TPA: TlpA disulfide reductase family protein [Thermoanaerobaculia bacterium]|jgi:cytochrome c biogenesis protein CcmG/thiol:disulfide interchange protein DsbE
MNRTVLIVGALLGVTLVGLLALSLGRDPQTINSPLIGRSAPTFALREVGSGRTVDLAQFRGKPVVINFWATWCAPCWQEHPVLVANARRVQPNVQFVGVVFQDAEDKIQGFLDARGSSYPTLIDEKGKTAIAYGVGGVPETYFLDASGRIVAKYNGPMTTDVLQEHLQKVMQ